MTTGALPCNVCQQPLPEPIHRTPQNALSSLRRTVEGILEESCRVVCGHIQAAELCDNGSFYDTEHDILVDSEEEDQIYAVEDGQKILRVDHQVTLSQKKLQLLGGLHEGACVVDLGCAKSATMRLLKQQRPDVKIHLFDISDRHVGFWEEFSSAGQWATYTIPSARQCLFNVVSSFFSPEYIPGLSTTLRTIHGLLCEDGRLYAIVSNTFVNTVDFLVAGHVNHSMRTSLQVLLASRGFELLELGERSHRGVLVVTVVRTASDHAASAVDPWQLADTVNAVNRLVCSWQRVANHLGNFETRHQGAPVVIYGAGFYGTYTASNLQYPHALRAPVDQNSYPQDPSLAGKPVIALTEIPEEVELVYLAVNPVIAGEVKHIVEVAFPNRFRYFQFES